MLREGVVERPDGRVVAWAEWGDAGGRPLLLLHGTPGCRFSRTLDPGLYERIGAHVATFDRPGYGRSSPHRDGTILSVADDALAVADGLGWDRFGVLGGSGGGPYALAVGFRGRGRTAAIGLVNPGGPEGYEDDNDDMLAVNREARRRAREGRESLEAFLGQLAPAFMADPNEALDAAMADAPAADREAMQSPQLRAYAVETMREAFVQGPQGWYDDGWRLTQPWGFELGDVSPPVRIWNGELDRNSPLAAARGLAAALRTVTLDVIPDAGHLGWRAHEERILRTLLG